MKKFLFIALMLASSFCASAQNDQPAMNDAGRIAISPYIDPSLGLRSEVCKQLTNKLNAILLKQGIAGTAGQRFIITANIDVNSEDIVVTTKEMFQYELTVNFIVGDGIEGTKYGMASQTIKGLGETKSAAYLAALKKVKTTDPVFIDMITEAKTRIVQYFNTQYEFIIAQAKALADKEDYDGAIYKLMSVPEVCKEAYDKCLAAVHPIYQKKIDTEGMKILADARQIWSAGLDVAAGERAADVLSGINPLSSAYAQAIALSDEIAKRVKELDSREWDFNLKKQQDEIDVEKARIKGERDVGVAYGTHQQPVYNIRTWWY